MQRMCLPAAVAVFLLVVLLYLPTLRGGFVYDSIAQVLYSDYIHTPSHWSDVLTLRVTAQDELDRNRPLHLASLMLDAAIWGKEPFGYRLTSVLLHALNASLLFMLIAAAMKQKPAAVVLLFAAFGALIFALHPLVVEAVAEPSNREDLLVMLPMLVGLLGIVRSSAQTARSRIALNAAVVMCSFFAVLAKESGIAVPFVFALACLLFRRAEFRSLLPGVVGGFAAAAGFLAASYFWRPVSSAVLVNAPPPLAGDMMSFLGIQLRIWTVQLWQMFWPLHLSAHYTAQAIAGIASPVAIAVVGAVAVAAFLLWRADRLAALGVAVFVLALLPASNFAPQYHPIADRYLYVPLAGIGMIAAAITSRLRIKYPIRFADVALFAACLVVLSAEYTVNLRRQFVWQQPMTLWTDVLRQYPRSAQALIGLANAHYRAGDFETALAAADEAVNNSSGRWAEPFALRALCEWQTGRYAPALESFRTARRLSRAYDNEESLASMLVWSSDQLQLLEIVRRSSP